MSVPCCCDCGLHKDCSQPCLWQTEQSELLKPCPGKVSFLISCSVLGLHSVHPLCLCVSAPSLCDDRAPPCAHYWESINTGLYKLWKEERQNHYESPFNTMEFIYINTHSSTAGEVSTTGVLPQYINVLLLLLAKALVLSFLKYILKLKVNIWRLFDPLDFTGEIWLVWGPGGVFSTACVL